VKAAMILLFIVFPSHPLQVYMNKNKVAVDIKVITINIHVKIMDRQLERTEKFEIWRGLICRTSFYGLHLANLK
jgi:hypothetical protein